MDEATKRQLVAEVPFWFHAIDLGDGVITPGRCPLHNLKEETDRMALPDLTRKSVLDIGTWDGYFAFEAERRGASRVVALDHYVWSLDLPAKNAYYQRCRAAGLPPEEYHLVPGLWHPETLPGKKAFDTARAILGSTVEPVVADFMTADLAPLGQFDIVFFRGVLYHMKNPLGALERVFSLTRELAIVETAAIRIPGKESAALFEFYGSSELNADISNWWAPNATALSKCCLAAGFRETRVVFETAADPGHTAALSADVERLRITLHACRSEP